MGHHLMQSPSAIKNYGLRTLSIYKMVIYDTHAQTVSKMLRYPWPRVQT